MLVPTSMAERTSACPDHGFGDVEGVIADLFEIVNHVDEDQTGQNCIPPGIDLFLAQDLQGGSQTHNAALLDSNICRTVASPARVHCDYVTISDHQVYQWALAGLF